jgi:hypothetical protein
MLPSAAEGSWATHPLKSEVEEDMFASFDVMNKFVGGLNGVLEALLCTFSHATSISLHILNIPLLHALDLSGVVVALS